MLNLEFFLDELPEKKVYLVDMSILSILLIPRSGCHINIAGRREFFLKKPLLTPESSQPMPRNITVAQPDKPEQYPTPHWMGPRC
jgi:hypothetical protein